MEKSFAQEEPVEQVRKRLKKSQVKKHQLNEEDPSEEPNDGEEDPSHQKNLLVRHLVIVTTMKNPIPD